MDIKQIFIAGYYYQVLHLVAAALPMLAIIYIRRRVGGRCSRAAVCILARMRGSSIGMRITLARFAVRISVLGRRLSDFIICTPG